MFLKTAQDNFYLLQHLPRSIFAQGEWHKLQSMAEYVTRKIQVLMRHPTRQQVIQYSANSRIPLQVE